MEYKSEPHNYLLASMESYQKLRDELETAKREIGTWRRRSTDGEGAFVTSRPLRSSTGFSDTRYRSSEGHLEGNCAEGGNLLVAEPGSLTITGPVGVEVGAKGRAVAVDSGP